MRILNENKRSLSDVILECNEATWIRNERKNFDWYKQTYPVLKNYNLPLSMDWLKAFYYYDMNDRNLNPNPEYYSCYAYLWSYFVGRISEQINFEGRTWFQLLSQNFPGAVKKTLYSDIPGLLLSMPWWVYLIAGVYVAEKIGAFD